MISHPDGKDWGVNFLGENVNFLIVSPKKRSFFTPQNLTSQSCPSPMSNYQTFFVSCFSIRKAIEAREVELELAQFFAIHFHFRTMYLLYICWLKEAFDIKPTSLWIGNEKSSYDHQIYNDHVLYHKTEIQDW